MLVGVPLAGTHHAALSVTDLDASIAWYQQVLGFEVIFQDESEGRRMTVLRFPGQRATLGLVQHTEPGAQFSPSNVGLDHLAFSVESAEELWAWPPRLEERSVPYAGPVETPFGGMLHFKDLDGIALALFWERG
jgi:glyoxylase I family protein